MAKKTTKRTPAKRSRSEATTSSVPKGQFQLVIVESPAKAKTIEK